MNCEAIKLMLAENSANIGRISRTRINRHLAACLECKEYAGDVTVLESLVSLPDNLDLPVSLSRRILDAAGISNTTSSTPKVSRAKFIKLGLATAAIGLVGLDLIWHPTNGISGEALAQEMFAASAKVLNVHSTFWATDITENGQEVHFPTLTKIEDQWYQNHCWRKEGRYGSRLIIGADKPQADGVVGTYYRYDSSAHRVIHMNEIAKQTTDFTLQGIIGSWYSNSSSLTTILGTEDVDGKKLSELAISSPGDKSHRDLCLVDTTTNLPSQVNFQNFVDGQWVTTSRYDLEFNQNLDPKLFDPSDLKDEGWSLKTF